MSVSANTLFHFTNLTALKGILGTRGLWPKYSKENFEHALPPTSNFHVAHIPMVCFCDLKLTQLCERNGSRHTRHFGEYGIGFKKSWGIENKVSPVSYVHSGSIASLTIDRIITTVNTFSSDGNTALVNSLSAIVKFLKPYQGYYQKGKRSKDLITYYDEREWRYIPPEDQFKVLPNREGTGVLLNELNIKLKRCALRFRPDDIKYIIVSKEREKVEIADIIRSTYKRKGEEIDLVSKIITQEEIADDF